MTNITGDTEIQMHKEKGVTQNIRVCFLGAAKNCLRNISNISSLRALKENWICIFLSKCKVSLMDCFIIMLMSKGLWMDKRLFIEFVSLKKLMSNQVGYVGHFALHRVIGLNVNLIESKQTLYYRIKMWLLRLTVNVNYEVQENTCIALFFLPQLLINLVSHCCQCWCFSVWVCFVLECI